MTSLQKFYQSGNTIAAVATAPGEGGVAIIRISGESALTVADRVFSGPVLSYRTHTLHYGQIIDEDGSLIDHVLLLVMIGERSYTGEDTVEIHCHGGGLITRRVLDRVLSAGARAAGPGEFTFKAFTNGKIDLVQAEAVQQLIGAKNEQALDAAGNQLQGRLSKEIRRFQKGLTEVTAHLEAWLDFPDEELEVASIEKMVHRLEEVFHQMQHLSFTYHDGKIVQEGIRLCLVGAPNVGKSSLMNALLNRNRAIVTDLPGTTRDTLEEDLSLNGMHFRLVDTAGIRHTAEKIEREGIVRSKQAMREADLTLLVIDAGRGFGEEDRALMEIVPKERTIGVWNKIDLPHEAPSSLPLSPVVPLSAKSGVGLDRLKKAIDQKVWDLGPPSRDELLLTNVRHKEAIDRALLSCRAGIDALKKKSSFELISVDLRQCLKELNRVIGTDITEDILSEIFSTFCIGK